MARTTGSDELFRLIHSLTIEEKGYFKKFAKRHTSKGNKYLQLFDAINKQQAFEETSHKKKFKAYAVMKVYLFDMIMQCLMIYQGKSAPQTNLLKQMIYTHILQSKGLQNKAIQLTRDALKTAEEREIFWLEEQFYRNDLIYSETKWANGEHLEKYRQVLKRIRSIRAKQDNKDEYIWAGHYALHVKVSETFRGKTEVNLDTLVDSNFLKNENNVLSAGNERYRLFALARYYDSKDAHEQANRTFRKLLKLETSFFKTKHPLYSPVYYWLVVRALITSNLRIKDYEAMPPLLATLLQIGQYEKRFLKDAQYFYCIRYADYFWRTGKHREGKIFFDAKLPVLLSREKENTDSVPDIIFLARKILFEYSMENYSRALLGISQMYSFGAKTAAPRLLADAEWMKLFIYLKMADYGLAKTTAANLLKQRSAVLSNGERQILASLKKVGAANSPLLLREAISNYKSSSKPVSILEGFDLLAALQHMQSKEPFGEIIRRSFK